MTFQLPSISRRLVVGMILVALTLGARVPDSLRYPLWQDEFGTERVVSKPSPRAATAQVIRRESTPPAFYLTSWALNRAAREHASGTGLIRVLRALPIVFSAGTTALTFLCAAELLPLWAAALAGLLVSFASELVLHGSELRAYSMLAFLCVTFALLLRRAVASPGRWRLLALASAVALGSLTHYFFLLTVATGAVWLFLCNREWRVVRRVSAAIALGLLPLLAWAPYWLRQYHNGNYATSPHFTIGRLAAVVSALFAPQALVAAMDGSARFALLFLVLGSAWALFLRRQEGRLSALLVLLPVLTAAGIAALGPRIFNSRNLIGVAPFAAISVSWACASMLGRRGSRVVAIALGASVVAGWTFGEVRLGRTPYNRIAHQMLLQGFRRNEPIVWFGRYGGFFPVAWYIRAESPRLARDPLRAVDRRRERCGAFEVVAEGPTGRRWLDRNRSALLAEASIPSYGDVPQGKRSRDDLIVARVRWSPGILSQAAVANALVLHRAGPVSPCPPQLLR